MAILGSKLVRSTCCALCSTCRLCVVLSQTPTPAAACRVSWYIASGIFWGSICYAIGSFASITPAVYNTQEDGDCMGDLDDWWAPTLACGICPAPGGLCMQCQCKTKVMCSREPSLLGCMLGSWALLRQVA